MPYISNQFRQPPLGAAGIVGGRSVAPSTAASVNLAEVEVIPNTSPQAKKPTVRRTPNPRRRGLSIKEKPISMGHDWQVDPHRIARELGIDG